MESPVVVDKPPEYHGNATNERGFPFDEEEGTGAWSELAARHPDIAARLRQRPATWARKRRPSSQDGVDDTNDFGGFDRFPFDDIPPEFREHFPSHWNRRFGSREDQFQQPQSPQPQPQPQSPQQQTAATQTDHDAGTSHDEQTLPQYGLRNTVDLGQKSQVDPSVVDADERSHRSMSAPPDHRTVNPNTTNKMSGQNHQEHPHQPEQPSNVRHIPIFVEGRDEPVINKNVDHGTHFAETKPAYVPPPQPHIDREQYFADDGPGTFPFAKGFDRPFFRQGPQPFTKQKMYPQAAAFTRGASPQRSQSPKPQTYHEPPRPETPSRQQKQPPQQKQSPQQKQPPPQQRQQPPPQQHQQQQQEQHPPQQKAQTPPPPPPQAPSSNDPITQILSIQTDVLNLMTDVENFTGTKKDKRYIYLDEMLTRNLIKLDNIETDGKENIRQARKEAIKCIQKCIAVLEAKAENNGAASSQPQDEEMQNENAKQAADQTTVQNGDVEMKDTKEEKIEQVQEQQEQLVPAQNEEEMKEKPEDVKKEEVKPVEKEAEPPVAETRPEEPKAPEATSELKPGPQKAETADKKQSPKKVVKKRDKSKDKKDVANETKKEEVVDKKDEPKDSKEEKKDVDKNVANESNENVNKNEIKDKQEIVDNKEKIEEVMQIDANAKGEVKETQAMEVDGGASQ